MNSIKLIKNHTKKLIPLGLSFFHPFNFIVLVKNLLSTLFRNQWNNYILKRKINFLELAMKGLNWIKASQNIVGSGGVGCYEFYRWTNGYPEVTGYIIPTFWDAYNLTKDEDFRLRALKMMEWELKIQSPIGGWEGCYEGDGKPLVIFNTGQVLRGLIRTYKETGNQDLLSSAIKAANWIVQSQDEDGSWTTSNFKSMKRVYDTYVTAPMSELYLITQDKNYKESCILNCEFVLKNQKENGWFYLCDNTLINNDAPITHTICYTMDGLIDTGINLNMEKYILSAKLTADAMIHKAEILPILPARFDQNWKGMANYVCNTGNAQFGIILLKLYELYGDLRYLNTALKIADFLAYVQELNSVGKYRNGGITGSYPVWGMYCPFKYPSWATKYYIDLMLLLDKHVGKK